MNESSSHKESLRPAELSAGELAFVREAARYLEEPGFLLRVANLVGKPAEGMLHALPPRARQLVGDATQSALQRALGWATRSLPAESTAARWPWGRLVGGHRFHLALTATTGAVGGLFGLAGAALEIPATTTLMLRSIAEIARENGADLHDPEVRLQCLAVFSFGAPRLETMESAYFSARLAMAMAVRDAAQYIARHGAQQVGHRAAPALVRLIQQIGARFQIVVTEKLAAQAVPVAGAAMGSLINAAFTDHFNRVASYHFGIVKLEKRYGAPRVRTAYLEAVASAREAAG